VRPWLQAPRAAKSNWLDNTQAHRLSIVHIGEPGNHHPHTGGPGLRFASEIGNQDAIRGHGCLRVVKSGKEELSMNIFRRPDYKSDATLFLDQLKTQKPGLEALQRQGRDLLWDKDVDRSAWVAYRAAQVAQKPYVYLADEQ
jgi:Protein of unknown function (DUF3460)